MKSIFAGTLANRKKGFSLFYNLSGTLYWLEVNASHPDILKDRTYQILPEAGTTITTQQVSLIPSSSPTSLFWLSIFSVSCTSAQPHGALSFQELLPIKIVTVHAEFFILLDKSQVAFAKRSIFPLLMAASIISGVILRWSALIKTCFFNLISNRLLVLFGA